MSWINLGEVYYTIHRTAGAAEAESTLALLRPMLALDAVTPDRVLAAARIKATQPLAYGDAFAVATPRIQRARQMIVMMNTINKNYFGGQPRVNFRRQLRHQRGPAAEGVPRGAARCADLSRQFRSADGATS